MTTEYFGLERLGPVKPQVRVGKSSLALSRCVKLIEGMPPSDRNPLERDHIPSAIFWGISALASSKPKFCPQFGHAVSKEPQDQLQSFAYAHESLPKWIEVGIQLRYCCEIDFLLKHSARFAAFAAILRSGAGAISPWRLRVPPFRICLANLFPVGVLPPGFFFEMGP